jgi:hypothetical protein
VISRIVIRSAHLYIAHVLRLTKQEQLVLSTVLLLLLTGWAVKAYRAAHPNESTQPQAQVK